MEVSIETSMPYPTWGMPLLTLKFFINEQTIKNKVGEKVPLCLFIY
jgi:hypothetical protein